MIITSTFKDYYDYVAHNFGGGDPLVRYIRNRVTSDKHDKDPGVMEGVKVGKPAEMPKAYDKDIRFAAVIIVGKVFPVWKRPISQETAKEGSPAYPGVDKMEEFQVCSQEYHPDMFVRAYDKYSYLGEAVRSGKGTDQVFPWALELCKQLRHPVLFVWNTGWMGNKVDKNIPKLAAMGFINVYPAEQIYQDIAYFVGNVINESPDIQPAGKPPQTNEEKIEAHGFDKRISFRHRK